MHGAESVTLHIPEDLEYPYKLIVTSAEGEEITCSKQRFKVKTSRTAIYKKKFGAERSFINCSV